MPSFATILADLGRMEETIFIKGWENHFDQDISPFSFSTFLSVFLIPLVIAKKLEKLVRQFYETGER